MTVNNVVEIEARVRQNLGSADSNRMRREGFIPAIVYNTSKDKGEGRCFSIALPSKEIEKEYQTGNFYTTVFHIKTDDKQHKEVTVVPRMVDLHPVSDKIIHIDFLPVEANKKVKVKIRLRFLNKDKSLGIKRGGYLNILHRIIECYCDPDKIVNSLDYDIEKMKVKDSIRVSNLTFPEGVTPVRKNDYIVANIIGRRGKDMGDSKSDADAAAAASGAAAAAAAATAAPAKGVAPAADASKDAKK